MGEAITGIVLQPRDVALLRELYESRVMTLAHIATLCFDGKREMAKKRLQKLKAAGLIRERKRHASEPSALFLTRKSFTLLRDGGELASYPAAEPADFDRRSAVSDLTLRHELQVMDVKAAMVAAIRNVPGLSVAQFSTWPALYAFRACRSDGQVVTLKPDGYIRIHETEADGSVFERAFFLELDRSTESQDRIVEKCLCYRDYLKSGGYALFCGGKREEAKAYPFRVLIVCKSEARRDNLAQRLSETQPPFTSMVMLTTFPKYEQTPLNQIWKVPSVLGNKDYQSLKKQSPAI